MKIPSQSNYDNFSKKELFDYIEFIEDLLDDYMNRWYKDYLIWWFIAASILLSYYFFYPQSTIAPASCMKSIEYACQSYWLPKNICEQPLNTWTFPNDYKK